MDHIVTRVLVDNGSSLNVMPKSTLNKLPFNVSHLRLSSMIVQAFDGTRRNVIGEIDLPVQIGPHICHITFQVMDINLTYNYLLGQPWIHSVGVVPLTLHQKLKFVVERRLVIVSREEDITLFCKITHASNIFIIHIHIDSLGRFVLIFSFNTNLGSHMRHLRFVVLFGRNNQHENTENGMFYCITFLNFFL